MPRRRATKPEPHEAPTPQETFTMLRDLFLAQYQDDDPFKVLLLTKPATEGQQEVER